MMDLESLGHIRERSSCLATQIWKNLPCGGQVALQTSDRDGALTLSTVPSQTPPLSSCKGFSVTEGCGWVWAQPRPKEQRPIVLSQNPEASGKPWSQWPSRMSK